MPKYHIHIETETLNEAQLRMLHGALSHLSTLCDLNHTPILRGISLSERVDLRFLEQHIAERVR